MIYIDLDSLSSTSYQLVRPVVDLTDFKTGARKSNASDQPLSKYVVAWIGSDGLNQMTVKAPEISGAAELKPGTVIDFSGLRALFYNPEGRDQLGGASFSADAAHVASSAAKDGGKA